MMDVREEQNATLKSISLIPSLRGLISIPVKDGVTIMSLINYNYTNYIQLQVNN